MKRNIGSTERVIRIAAGLAILALAFVGPKTDWAFLGIVPLATGLIGWCPPYALFGFSTCKTSCSGSSAKTSSCGCCSSTDAAAKPLK